MVSVAFGTVSAFCRRRRRVCCCSALIAIISFSLPANGFVPGEQQSHHSPTARHIQRPREILLVVPRRSFTTKLVRRHAVPFSVEEMDLSNKVGGAVSYDAVPLQTLSSQRMMNIDVWLNRLTTAFPLFVLSSALLALTVPKSLEWVNSGGTVTAMLASVMFGTGLTLQQDDFAKVWASRQNRAAIPLGIACQFGIMPLSAFLVGKALFLQGSSTVVSSVNQALFLGLCLVGCAPGGTASNLVSLIAGADVALSVILTTCATMAAVFMTPLLVKIIVNTAIASVSTTAAAAVSVSGWSLCLATAKVVVLPVLAGMMFKAKAPKLANTVSRYTPFASVLLVSLICGGVVAQTAPLLLMDSSLTAVPLTTARSLGTRTGSLSSLGTCLVAFGLTTVAPLVPILALPFLWNKSSEVVAPVLSSAVGLPAVATSVLLLHVMGFGVGYLIPKLVFPNKEKSARTISIEVGMQNSALAVVLARSIAGLHPAAALPGAISATVHSCLGSILAAFWRLNKSKED